jgi:FtsP/CotA-like multicopper oxidase with cupredoxin domain
MYLPENASRIRRIEAQKARDNRAEIVRALNQGQVSRRDLIKWGIFTVAGGLALKNGLSPYAQSAFAAVPTGTPRSPLFGAAKFTQPFQRLNLQKPTPLVVAVDSTGAVALDPLTGAKNYVFQGLSGEKAAKKTSYHTDWRASPTNTDYQSRASHHRGPIEGRPDGQYFEHQRWNTFVPKVGYVLSMASAEQPAPLTGTGGLRFHPFMPAQQSNSVWSYGTGRDAKGRLPAPLIKARYGESIITRIYNNLPESRADNNGFGRNEISNHFHNAHNGAESDGACNAFHFPGTFYDYHWSTALARHDSPSSTTGTGIRHGDPRASGPDGNGGLVPVKGDYRELQGTMWFHDHRFFFTAENVYKGMAGCVNYYSGPDRGRDNLTDGVNLRLPSGNRLDWGNTDFDVNLMISDAATDPAGQLFFDIFNTDGFLGDMLLVNHTYAPVMEVLPRRYRFRILNACMSRFVQLAIANPVFNPMRITFIANDGNFVEKPITLFGLDQQGVAERYDIIVDFTGLATGTKLHLVNLLRQTDGRLPDVAVSMGAALAGDPTDPAVGPIMQFRIVSELRSVDDPNFVWTRAHPDNSQIPLRLTDNIPIVAPVRTRVVEFSKANGDSRDPVTGQCTPDCAPGMPFPWVIKVNGQTAHSMNANRISLLIPQPGEVEHWTYVNSSANWDHPIHLHFEEGITMNRGTKPIPATEKNVRKDVWRTKPGGSVQFQVQFGEFGGAYVNHCHNTVHEDFAMLLRFQLMSNNSDGALGITQTPNPTLDGVVWTTPEILPEGDPRPPV